MILGTDQPPLLLHGRIESAELRRVAEEVVHVAVERNAEQRLANCTAGYPRASCRRRRQHLQHLEQRARLVLVHIAGEESREVVSVKLAHLSLVRWLLDQPACGRRNAGSSTSRGCHTQSDHDTRRRPSYTSSSCSAAAMQP